MDYYETKHNLSGQLQKVCWYCIVGIVLVLILSCFTGCKTHKAIENTETKDSVRTEYIEKIIKDTVIVTVEVPAEAKERETNDSTSFLETSFAKSTASMKWKDGVPWLFHSLENKPQKIDKPVEVESKEKTKIIYRTRYTTKYKYVKVELSWWQELRMHLGEIMLMFMIAGVLYGVYRIWNKFR